MKRSYRSNRQYRVESPLTYGIISFACIACWLLSYVVSVGFPVYGEVTAAPLWNKICLSLDNKALTYLIGLLLMGGGGFLIQRSNYALVLIREKTFLPFLIFSLLISTNTDFIPLKSTSVAVFCLILAMYQLFSSYHDPDSVKRAFNAAFFIAIGSLLWVHILWFLPLFWLGMYQFRSLSLKTITASLVGLLTVYWFLFGWSLWTEDFSYFTIPLGAFTKIRPLSITGTTLIDWLNICFVLIVSLVAVFHFITHDHEDSLRSRQFLSFLILFGICSYLLFFIYEQSSEEFLQITCIAVSILLAHYFTTRRNKYTFALFYLGIFFLTSLYMYRLWSY
ncbi:DUF6427 family protein [Parabacteroides sp. OttesenSCG-928-N08]|nr:DUF6427 family protein [Parabacteroides sp. OttesenSCG-928-N08]